MGLIVETEELLYKDKQESMLEGLDKYQKEAVGFKLSGNLLCNSIAGSGKTHVLTRRVGYLIANGVNQSQIMLLTFTNKAAKEMTDRVANILDTSSIHIKSGTFHSIAARYLRTYATNIGYSKNFTILDADDSVKLINDIRSEMLEELEIPRKNFIKGSEIAGIYSDMINLKLELEDFGILKSDNIDIVGAIIEEYKRVKFESNLMDFDDLLINFNKVLDIEEIRKNLQEEVKYLLVDEYQDINYLQDGIIKKISDKKNVFAVGDPSQSIYKFRGSDISYIQNFKKEYNSEEVNLKLNYRSDQNVLKLAEKSINHNIQEKYIEMLAYKDTNYNQRFKRYQTMDSETDGMVNEIQELLNSGVSPSEICVLVRSTFMTVPRIEKGLRKKNIDYDLRAGKSYFEKVHIKDLIAILTLIVNPKCVVSFKRLMGLLVGVGAKTAETYFELYKELDYSFNNLEQNKDLIKGSKKAKESFIEIIDLYVELEDINVLKDKIQYINNSFYKKHLLNHYSDDDNYDQRYLDIVEFASVPEGISIEDFLEDITLNTDLMEDDLGEGKIVVSTMHRAKGLEWDYVFIPFLNQGVYPKKIDEFIEEERRLFYVALTRAKKTLYLSNSKFDPYEGSMLENSIFVEEIIR